MDVAPPEILTDETRGRPTIQAQRVLPVFGLLLLVIAGLAAVNTVLVHLSHEHRYETGRALFQRGQALRAAGRNREAPEAFRSAHNQDPQNIEYHLGFVRALRSTGRVREARNSLDDLLRRRPADGAANTEMARLLSAEGDWSEAAWYYHRALYGQWPTGMNLRPVRFELADLLAAHGAKQELLAELLLLGEPATDGADAKHVGALLLAAGDPARAEELYRNELERNASDPALWIGLGRAQFASGRHLAAERSFRRAGNVPEAREEFELVTSVNALDPTLRRLGSVEKHRRAHELARRLVTALHACAPLDDAVRTAAESLEKHAGARRAADFTENDLDLVDHFWTTRWTVCPTGVNVPREVAIVAADL